MISLTKANNNMFMLELKFSSGKKISVIKSKLNKNNIILKMNWKYHYELVI